MACMNEEKGGIAKKYCSVACTGCEKCVEVCRYDSVTVTNNLAVIDPEKCRLCKECVYVCKSSSILMVNFPPPKDRAAVKDRPNRKLARTRAEAGSIEAAGIEVIEAENDVRSKEDNSPTDPQDNKDISSDNENKA